MKTLRPRINKTVGLSACLTCIVLVALGIWISNGQNTRQQTDSGSTISNDADNENEEESEIRNLVSSEELILELTPQLDVLSRSVLNLGFPDSSATKLFLDQVEISGHLTRSAEPLQSAIGTMTSCWNVADFSEIKASDELEIWQSLFEETEYVENAGFYFVRGSFDDNTFEKFSSVVGFDGLARLHSGRHSAWHADLRIGWNRVRLNANRSVWRIRSWQVNSFETMEVPRPLFSDVLAAAVTDENNYAQARISKHEQITSALVSGKPVNRPTDDHYPFFAPEVTLEHPGVNIVDIDLDGFDDIFVAMQHDANLLFRNKGDGTFEEVAKDYGLTTSGDSTSAIFADFDNDGDPDLFLGRARHRSQYWVNDGGQFIDRSAELINMRLPFMVSSISAADYNGDGLLDVYICTYSPIEEMHRFAKQTMPLWSRHFLTRAEFHEIRDRLQTTHSFLGRPGPPNVLLMNIGDGKFELAPENEQLQLWRKSFQASWSDFDRDGDPDLFVTNDFAPDNLFRNDSPEGFTDITDQVGLANMGFGMGVSWGDYDNDGQMDIYVSNMFSKAGQRITDQITGIDHRFREMASGNFLYRNLGEKFSLVSGIDPPALQVAKAGWSWGGQFFDWNNDGFRDVYVASGFYTAPGDVAVNLDL